MYCACVLAYVRVGTRACVLMYVHVITYVYTVLAACMMSVDPFTVWTNTLFHAPTAIVVFNANLQVFSDKTLANLRETR